MITTYSDRSRLAKSYKKCPRLRWWEYEHPAQAQGGKVNGLRSIKLNMDFVTGIGFHTGVEHLLHGKSVDESVGIALEGYWEPVRAYGFNLEVEDDASYIAYEQAAMVEALIRGWAIAVLPLLLERFEILEIEKEEEGIFTLPEDDKWPAFGLIWGARTDALLLDKDSGDLYILSEKTTKEFGKRSMDAAQHDMQGLSEIAAVEQRLKRWQDILDASTDPFFPEENGHTEIPGWFVSRYAHGSLPLIMGVKMEFALKGRRAQEPYGSGTYKYSNPLIRPWKKSDDLHGAGGALARNAYAFKFNYQDPMGGNHRLGKGWNRINIWEDIGVKEWIGMLANETIQGFPPMTGVSGQFVQPIENFRNEDDILRWERSTKFIERRIAVGRKECLSAFGTPQFEEKLDEHFPMNEDACDWPTKCPKQEICYGPRAYLTDPFSSLLYTIRTANHPIEESLRNEE